MMLPVAPKFPLQHLVASSSPGDFSLLRVSQAASQLMSFCSCNKKKVTDGQLCWQLIPRVCAGPWKWEHSTRVLSWGHPQSTQAAALLCSRSCSPACPLSVSFLQTLASRQSSGSPWNSSPSQQVCAELFPFLSHGVCRDNGEMWHLGGALSMGVGLTPSSALLNLPPFQCGSSSASALEVLWAWNSLCSCLDPCAARIRVIL